MFTLLIVIRVVVVASMVVVPMINPYARKRDEGAKRDFKDGL